MKTILITGGAGFIGSHLSQYLLERGERVICVDNFLTSSEKNITPLTCNNSFKLIRHDIVDPLFIEESVDEIYNLACPASPVHYQNSAIHTVKANTIGVINMLGLAKAKKAKILQASTSEVYGDPKFSPQSEEYRGNVNPIGPRACYDEGKRCAETLFFDYYRSHGIKTKLVRIFNTYGPRMAENDGRVVSNFITQALRGKDITLYGKGDQTRSFCYVDDLVKGLVKMMASGYKITGPINLGNPNEITVMGLAKMIINLTQSGSKIIFLPLPQDDPTNRCPDISKAKAILNWTPLMGLQAGLEKTIEYFKKNLEYSLAHRL